MAFNGTGANVTTLNAENISSGTLAVGRGGTGATTLNAAAVIIGNGTSAPTFVAPGTSGNLLTSNGSAWTSAAPAGGGVTSFNGNTGALNGLQFITSGSIGSGATTINITGLPTDYIFFRFLIIGQLNSTNSGFEFGLKVSTNNGSSYTNDIYRFAYAGVLGNGGIASQNMSAQESMRLGPTVSSTGTSSYITLDFNLYQPVNGVNRLFGMVSIEAFGDSGPSQFNSVNGSANNGTYVNAIQILRSSGSKAFSGGNFYVYGAK
jgi:hypothetical protein